MYSFLSWFYFFWLDLLHRPEHQHLIILKCGRVFSGFGCGKIQKDSFLLLRSDLKSSNLTEIPKGKNKCTESP